MQLEINRKKSNTATSKWWNALKMIWHELIQTHTQKLDISGSNSNVIKVQLKWTIKRLQLWSMYQWVYKWMYEALYYDFRNWKIFFCYFFFWIDSDITCELWNGKPAARLWFYHIHEVNLFRQFNHYYRTVLFLIALACHWLNKEFRSAI